MERDPACPSHDSRCTLDRCVLDPQHPQHGEVLASAIARSGLGLPVEREHIAQFFAYEHLPPHLQEVSKPFCEVAGFILTLPRNAERTMALRKLLESKDCAVRARLSK